MGNVWGNLNIVFYWCYCKYRLFLNSCTNIFPLVKQQETPLKNNCQLISPLQAFISSATALWRRLYVGCFILATPITTGVLKSIEQRKPKWQEARDKRLKFFIPQTLYNWTFVMSSCDHLNHLRLRITEPDDCYWVWFVHDKGFSYRLIKREGEGMLTSEQWLNYQASKYFIFLSWKANDEQPLRVFGDKLYPRDRCETYRTRIEQILTYLPLPLSQIRWFSILSRVQLHFLRKTLN